MYVLLFCIQMEGEDVKSERFNLYDRKTGKKIQILFVDAAFGGSGGASSDCVFFLFG